MPNVSIVITAQDRYSDTINKIITTNRAFCKELDGLNQRLDYFNERKWTIKLSTDKAVRELRDVRKAYEETGDALKKAESEAAQAKFTTAEDNLRAVEKAAKDTRKEIETLGDTMNRQGSSSGIKQPDGGAQGGTSGGVAGGGTAAAPGKSGLTEMLWQSVQGAADAVIGSALGDDAGNMVSGVLGGAVTGAAMGSIVPGIGTAIGAIVGAIGGAITSATQTFEKKDDYFKNLVQEKVQGVLDEQQASLDNGSVIAASREKNKLAFSTLLGGEQNATEYLSQMTDFAAKTPFEYDDLTAISKTLLAYNYDQDELLPMIQSIGDAGAALGMDSADMNAVASYLGKMNTTGKTSMEYLNPLIERGIDIYAALSELPELAGKSNQEIQEMVSKGLIPGEQAAAAIVDYMGETYVDGMNALSQTYDGLTSTLKDAQDAVDAARGEGYNEKRKEGLKRETKFLTGESGDKMKEAYKALGVWEAEQDNEHQRLIDEQIEYTMSLNDYQTADAVEQGRMIMEAKIAGEAEYMDTEGYELKMESEIQLIEKSGELLAKTSWEAGYAVGEAYNKGVIAAMNRTKNEGNLKGFAGWEDVPQEVYDQAMQDALTYGGKLWEYVPDKYKKGGTSNDNISSRLGYAVGSYRVPYTGIALVHEGEVITPASKAKEKVSSGAKGAARFGDIIINNYSGDSKDVADAVIAEIEKRLEIAAY